MTKKISGTKEWSSHSENCCQGCHHDCKYCYAKYNAIKRFKTVKEGEWTNEVCQFDKLNKKAKTYKGTVMFPTMHDITPGNHMFVLTYAKRLLQAGNTLLVVSKPHKLCMEMFSLELGEFKERILFRFTIGAKDDAVLKFWEPGAPSFEERYECLKFMHGKGFQTSISMEPLLEHEAVFECVKLFEPYVTDAIWIGMLNNIDKRVENDGSHEFPTMVNRVKAGQTPERVKEIYEILKGNSKVKWKESYKSVLGLELPTESGKDV